MDTPDPRSQASAHRKALHKSIADRDLEAVRTALYKLYADDASPLKQQDMVRKVEAFAPIVEGAIVARIHAPDTAIAQEMALNLQHTHASFGLPADDYEAITAQLAGLSEGGDPHAIDWCAGTCLHGRVKPFRHERLFLTPPGNASLQTTPP